LLLKVSSADIRIVLQEMFRIERKFNRKVKGLEDEIRLVQENQVAHYSRMKKSDRKIDVSVTLG